MKCCRCPFVPAQGPEGDADECGYWENFGTVWKDGQEGCRLTRRQIEKIEDQHADYLGMMGLEMGMEMDFKTMGISMDKVVSDCCHMIGLDGIRHKPYMRHGKKFFRPWRNYWCGREPGLEWMSSDAIGLAEKWQDWEDRYPYYRLTRKGLEWLGRRIGIVIHDERDE